MRDNNIFLMELFSLFCPTAGGSGAWPAVQHVVHLLETSSKQVALSLTALGQVA